MSGRSSEFVPQFEGEGHGNQLGVKGDAEETITPTGTDQGVESWENAGGIRAW